MSNEKTYHFESLASLIARWESTGGDEEYLATEMQDLAFEIAQRGPEAARFLQNQLSIGDENQLSGAIVGVSVSELPVEQRLNLLRPFVEHSLPAIQQQAIQALTHLQDRSVSVQIEHHLASSLPSVQIAALNYMCKLFPSRCSSLVEGRLSHPNPRIREAAIDEVEELGDKLVSLNFAPRVLALLADEDRSVRAAARWYCHSVLLGDDSEAELWAKLTHETDQATRAALISKLIDLGDIEAARAGSNDPAAVVRLAIVDVLDGANLLRLELLVQAHPTFVRHFMDDPDPRVTASAQVLAKSAQSVGIGT